MKAYILRGPSGCGKSTYVDAHMKDNAVMVSADLYFMRRNHETGEMEYQFNPAKLSQAHNACMRDFLKALRTKMDVFVDNTNIHWWEYSNYVDMAIMMGYEVVIVEFPVRTVDGIKLCIQRNSHGVPADIVARMCIEFEPYDGSCKVHQFPVGE